MDLGEAMSLFTIGGIYKPLVLLIRKDAGYGKNGEFPSWFTDLPQVNKDKIMMKMSWQPKKVKPTSLNGASCST
jgi:hypothetical protein